MSNLKFECPSCNRPIANRRSNICMYCESELPKELLFTTEQSKKLEETKQKDKERHEDFMKKPFDMPGGNGGGGDFGGDFGGGDC